MTEKLERAFERAKGLSERNQDVIAALILEEIEDEARWDTAFASSHSALEQLAAEAEEEDRHSRTEVLDPGTL